MISNAVTSELQPETKAFYQEAVKRLTQSRIPFLLGGAYALERYTGIVRHTKDLDVFVRAEDCRAVLDLFSQAGFHTELTFPHWLGKVYHLNDFVDVIFSSGNGVAQIDDLWFQHAADSELWGLPVRLCPPEEMIWSKAYIMERERFDGADIAHILRACGPSLHWKRLLDRFGPDWRVLLSHLVLFGYVYPEARHVVPTRVMEGLLHQLTEEGRAGASDRHVCNGTIISREQYLIDIHKWGYEDARLLRPDGMTPEEITRWTAAIGDQVRH